MVMPMTKNLNVKIDDETARLFSEIKTFVGKKTNDEAITLCIKAAHKFIVKGENP